MPRRKIIRERSWEPGSDDGPVAYLTGHLDGRFVGDPVSLRAAVKAAVCSVLGASGMSADEALAVFDTKYLGRLSGIHASDGGVVLDFVSGEPDEPFARIHLCDLPPQPVADRPAVPASK